MATWPLMITAVQLCLHSYLDAQLMTNVEKLTPVLIKFVRIHVLVEIMLSAELSSTNLSAPVKKVMKEIQMWLVSKWSVEWMMIVWTHMLVATNNVAQFVAQAMLHVEEKPSVLLWNTKLHAAVLKVLRVIHLSPVERLNADQTLIVQVIRLASTITVSHLARLKIHAKVSPNAQ